MLRPPEYFGEHELALIYIAKKLREALALEKALTERGIDYLIETDTYRGGVVFQSTRVGAFFYVLPEVERLAREILQHHGYRPFEPLG
jgi:hypothetical protein